MPEARDATIHRRCCAPAARAQTRRSDSSDADPGVETLGTLDGVDRDERPVRLVVRAFDDPALQQRLLGLRQRQVRLGRRHHVVFEVRVDPADELAPRRIARLDDRPAVADVLERAFARVEAELGLPLGGVRAVAAETSVGQQRPDLEAEVDARNRRFRRARRPQRAAGLAADRHAGETGERAKQAKPAKERESAFLVSFSLCASAPAVSRRPPPMREPSRHARPPSKRPRAGHPCSPAGPRRRPTARTRWVVAHHLTLFVWRELDHADLVAGAPHANVAKIRPLARKSG